MFGFLYSWFLVLIGLWICWTKTQSLPNSRIPDTSANVPFPEAAAATALCDIFRNKSINCNYKVGRSVIPLWNLFLPSSLILQFGALKLSHCLGYPPLLLCIQHAFGPPRTPDCGRAKESNLDPIRPYRKKIVHETSLVEPIFRDQFFSFSRRNGKGYSP